ncbi:MULTISPECIES: phosphodiester glycosidase family protein [Streptomyces]|uniref:phosphodiester glycosidase family protein n=1 Tax=Streptomyces TaxID=1883 RepID=UPI0016705C5E|nr:phosphodiester glycosidase family protein [Streptomyces ruber]
MVRRAGRFRSFLTVLAACGALAGGALVGAPPAGAVPKGAVIAPGVGYRQLKVPAASGTARAHVLTVDLRAPGVRVGLLRPGVVAARAPVSRLADGMHAVAGVNGDFFHISEAQHRGVRATGAPVGPAVADGRPLKGAVPNGQRFGPALPPGTSTRDVLGVGTDRTARLDGLALDGAVTTALGVVPLGGLNQYALPRDSVGAFTADWGSASRVRAVCGSDTDRAAPCSADTYEVTVRGGRVASVTRSPGGGAISSGTTVLVGREEGARWLRGLSVGDRVGVRHRLVAARSRTPYAMAVGGTPVLRDGRPLPRLDGRTAAVRTVAGIADGGRRLLLVALDGAPEHRRGLTVAETARLMRRLGAQHALNLDGGGSSTLVARRPGARAVSVRNHPSGGAERPVPNGIGVFVGR